MSVLSVPGLHEDHAQFHGGFEDEFAVALGVAGIVEGDELVGDGASAAGEIGDASAQGLGGGGWEHVWPGLTEELADGFEELGGVLGDDADGCAIDDEAIFSDSGLDDKILLDRDAEELGAFEVDRTEAVEESDEAVGVAAGDGEVGAAEGLPGWGAGLVEFLVVNAAKELGVGGGTSSGDGGKGAALAEETAEVDGFAGIGRDLRFVHRGSRGPRGGTNLSRLG